jgi:hypothetical protein
MRSIFDQTFMDAKAQPFFMSPPRNQGCNITFLGASSIHWFAAPHYAACLPAGLPACLTDLLASLRATYASLHHGCLLNSLGAIERQLPKKERTLKKRGHNFFSSSCSSSLRTS